VDAAILAELAHAGAQTKAVLIELAGARGLVAAKPAVRQALEDSNEAVRLAALAALGQLIDLQDFDLLTSRALAAGGSTEKTAAQAALQVAALRTADRDASAAKLAAALQGASVDDQTYLLEVLGKISGKKALETVVASAKSNDPAVKDAATRVLGEWPNAEAAESLLDLARNDSENKYRVRALRGYIRIARQLQLPDDTKLAMFHTAMDMAKRNEDKQVALDILSRIPSVKTLQLAVSFVGQPALRDQAADAAVKIAAKLVGPQPQAVAEAMQKVVDAGVGGNPGSRAKQLLAQAKGTAK
jgi:HEAT repeat protein